MYERRCLTRVVPRPGPSLGMVPGRWPVAQHHARASKLTANRQKPAENLRPERSAACAVLSISGHRYGRRCLTRVVPRPGPSLGMVPGRWPVAQHHARASKLTANRQKPAENLRPERSAACAVLSISGHRYGRRGLTRVVPRPGPSLGMVPGRWPVAQHHVRASKLTENRREFTENLRPEQHAARAVVGSNGHMHGCRG